MQSSVFVQCQVILMVISYYINFGLGKTLLHFKPSLKDGYGDDSDDPYIVKDACFILNIRSTHQVLSMPIRFGFDDVHLIILDDYNVPKLIHHQLKIDKYYFDLPF